MKLNQLNGDILIGDICFTANWTLLNIEEIKELYNLELEYANSEYTTYGVADLDNGGVSLQISFRSGFIKNLRIWLGSNYDFPPYMISSEEKTIIEQKFKLLGGKMNYLWGEVTLFEDNKGGSISIIISYHLAKITVTS